MARFHRTYDHRVKQMIVEHRNPDLFPSLKIPKSTSRGWIKKGIPEVVTLNILDKPHEELIVENEKLKRTVEQLKASYQLSSFTFKLFGLQIQYRRLPFAHAKSMLLSAIEHGRQKLIFVKPLTKDVKMKLKGSNGKEAQLDIEELPIFGDDGLLALVRKRIPDHRSKKGRRFRGDGFFVLCVLAIMSGAKGYTDIHRWISNAPSWLLDELRIAKAPCISQVRRFIKDFDVDEIEKILTEWLLEHVDLAGKQICFDGKTVRGSRNAEAGAIQLASATTADKGIVIAQRRIPETTNEIPIVRQMINDLPLGCSTISADAAHSQVETVSLIATKTEGGVFIFKDNQPTAKRQIKEALFRAFPPSAAHDYNR